MGVDSPDKLRGLFRQGTWKALAPRVQNLALLAIPVALAATTYQAVSGLDGLEPLPLRIELLGIRLHVDGRLEPLALRIDWLVVLRDVVTVAGTLAHWLLAPFGPTAHGTQLLASTRLGSGLGLGSGSGLGLRLANPNPIASTSHALDG